MDGHNKKKVNLKIQIKCLNKQKNFDFKVTHKDAIMWAF